MSALLTLRHRLRAGVSWSLPTLLAVAVIGAEPDLPCPIQLRDVTRQTGIDFVHTDGSSGRRYIVETVSAGLALLDYDGDGDVDIYFINGAPLPGAQMNPPPRNRLYRNDGGWKFTDVTEQAGVGDTGYALGVCTGDYDNDGDLDIYVNNYGHNVLYRNNGNGTFTDVTREAGVDPGHRVGAGASFLDLDGDGDLDLFISNYIEFTFETHGISHMSGFPAYVGPLHYPMTANVLYRNNGNGTFTDVSIASGIAASRGSGMGMICADYDNDRDTDIIVGNDLGANFVFQNDGTGKFKEVGAAIGLAYDAVGNVHGTMAVECADWNHDGWLDFFTTAYQRQMATLYENNRGVYFEDISRQTGAGSGTYPNVTWGTALVDLDNDTHRDIFIACGHLIDNVDQFDDTTSYHARNIVLQNTGKGRFINVSDRCGDGLLPKLSSRGAGFDDLDNDGDVDIVILNSRREPTLLRNDSTSSNHWLQVKLRGTKTNRDGIGARVSVTSGGLTQIDEVHSGRSYQSDFGKRLYFGLGQRKTVEQIQVRWIGGGVDTVRDVPIDRLVTIEESRGLVR
ncbi:MAG: CRTAC1 family protein [Verrucomicrobiia bacterium]